MSRVVTIDVEARFVDNVTDESKAASKAIEGIGKEADKLNKKKAKPTFDADDNLFLKKIRNMEAKMNKMGHTKTAAVLDLVDKASSKLMSISSNTKKVTSGLESLTKKTWTTMVKVKDMALAPIKAIKNALFSIPTLITAVVSAKIVQKAVLEPINLADQYSSAKIGFETLLGESKAVAMMNDIDLFAKATPFKTSNVISNVQKMMAYGWDVERVIDDMETIGDAAAATGKGDAGLESIVRALAEIRSKGKLSTQELNQLAGAGIKAKAYLAEGLGYGSSDAGMMKLAKDLEGGAIGANKAIELILQGMQEFDGMMDKTANETVEGLKSQLEDVFEINIARRWGQGLQDGAKRGLGTIVSLLDDADESLAAVGDTLYELGQTAANWVADKLEAVVDKINEITGSFEFKNASAKDKASMLWEGVVKDPLKKWWEETGKTAVTETATDIGKSIGKGILGGIEMAWNAMPWWGKLLVGGYAAGKTVSGLGNVVSGAMNLFGSLGSTGGYINAGAGYMKTQGGGLLGTLSKAGYSSLGTAGFGMSGGLAALAGGATIAGLAGAAVSTIHTFSSLGKAIKDFDNGDKVSAKSNLAKSGSTAIGLGAGALGAMGMAKIGGAIGTFFGGPLGTAVGAGIGGLAGMFFGDKIAKNIEAAKYEHEGLKNKIKEGADEAEILAAHEKALWENAQKHFGKIKLSTEEIQSLTKQLVWGDELQYFEAISSATKSVEANTESVKTASADISKYLWKSGLGIKFNADEMEAFTASIDDYVNSSKAMLENAHYKFSTELGLLVDSESDIGKKLLNDGNEYFSGLQKQVEELSSQLSKKIQKAMEDGVISSDKVKLPDGTLQLSEQEEIKNLQNQISSILEEVSNQEFAADMEMLKIKWDTKGFMDNETFDAFIEEGSGALKEKLSSIESITRNSIAGLGKMYTKGSTEYEDGYKAIVEGYHTMVKEARETLIGEELSIMGQAFARELGTDAATDLRNALENAIDEGVQPINLSDKVLSKWLNVDAKSIEGETGDNIRKYLQALFDQVQLVRVNGQLLIDLGITTDSPVEDKVKKYFNDNVPDTVEKNVNVLAKPSISPVSVETSKLFTLSSYTWSPTIRLLPSVNDLGNSNKGGPRIKKYRGGFIGGTSALEAFALGGRPTDGMLKGSTRFISVNEESPEMIIPLSSQRRTRAMKLWAKTGSLLGVPGFARGGMTVGGQDEGIRFQSYGSNDTVSGQEVNVDIGGLTFAITVSGNDAQSITAAIKEQAEEIAEVVAGVLADALGAQFENTPVRGGGVA